jgi:GDPmannose 4,6-dehydratase
MNSPAQKTALITGLRGQDGSYLAEHLLAEGYRVVGTSHAGAYSFSLPAGGLEVEVEMLDLSSTSDVRGVIGKVRPDEVYNLAARSSSAQLFDDPLATAEINGLAAVRFLEAIREVSPHTRFCQAASSELFAGCDTSPQDENTPFRPINAYGAAKTYAANIVAAYRARHGLFATTAILFNHESPRRGLEYVTRKITHTVARIALGQATELMLGDLDSRRDWGFASDYARAMWLMLQQPVPEDFVVATGETHSVRELCEIAFSHVGLDYLNFVRINPQWARRTETLELRGNPAKAMQRLGWQPSVGFADLVCMMVDADLAQLKSNTNQP